MATSGPQEVGVASIVNTSRRERNRVQYESGSAKETNRMQLHIQFSEHCNANPTGCEVL